MITDDRLAMMDLDDDGYNVITVCNRTLYVEHGEYILHDYSLRIALATILCVIFTVGIFGNSLVILAVTLSRRLQDTTNVFVVNLAVADLLTCLLLPIHAGTILHKGSCHIPDVFCKLVAALTLTTVGCSVVSMALIAFNRYHLIQSSTYPKRALLDVFKKRNVIAMVAFSWLYPVFLMCVVIPAGVGSLGYSLQYKVCSQDSDNDNSDYLSLTGGLFVQLPAFLIIIVCYSLILRFVRYNDRSLAKHMSVHSTSTSQSEIDVAISVDHVDDPSASTHESPCQQDSSPSSKEPSNHVQSASLTSPSLPERPPSSSSASTFCSTSIEAGPSYMSPEGNAPPPVQPTPYQLPADVFQVPANAALQNQSSYASDLSNDHQSTKATSSVQHNADIKVIPRSTSRKTKTASSSSDQVLTLDRISVIKMKRLYKKQLRITINLFIVVCAYTLCVVPLGVAVLIPPSDPVIPWFTVLFLSSCCVNPIIYALKHPTFGEVFACILKCRFKKIPEPSQWMRCMRGCRGSC